MSLKRLHQLFLVEEATEATATTLFTAANGSYLVIDPTIEFEAPRFERQINRSSLTPLQGLSGIQTGSLKFGLELTGTTAFGTVPQFGLPLRACGFRQFGGNRLQAEAVQSCMMNWAKRIYYAAIQGQGGSSRSRSPTARFSTRKAWRWE